MMKNRAYKQKIRYRTLRNKGIAVADAKRGSTWSDEKILDTYNISIPSKLPTLKAKPKMDLPEKRRIRYTKVKQVTLDTQLAKKVSMWSDEKILNELGIVIPKKMPKVKSLPRKTSKEYLKQLKKAQLELAKFQYAKDRGIAPQVAKKYMRKSWKTIKDIPIFNVDIMGPKATIKMRRAQWKKWTIEQNFPPEIESLAHMINRSKKYDENARWGWAVLAYAYRYDQKIEIWMERLKPEKNPDLYQIEGKVIEEDDA